MSFPLHHQDLTVEDWKDEQSSNTTILPKGN